eukprot:TRINITY_DN15399_c0_g1_i2.p2 TRINITY_DN15399_c0_g1~~TRINITY_DN15399_c0_g1_i2.p2  ORF type:complete len:332 (-),score=66.49 TRINITY_DN15399_c0_g1_i2:1966-2961(-)
MQYMLTCIPHMFTCMTRQLSGTRFRKTDTTSDAEADPVISGGELTRLWKEQQSKAVDIINNDCHTAKQQTCPIDTETIEKAFVDKCRRSLVAIPTEFPWQIDTPTPEWTPSVEAFTEEEILTVINSLPSRKSPGADGVTYDTVKHQKKRLCPVIRAIANICLTNRRVPADWKHGIITLIPKKNGDPTVVDDWRPISLLPTSYKLFMKLILNRQMRWIVDTNRLSKRQKGAMPRNGLQEHVFCLRANIADFLHTSASMYTAFFDIKDAFGSIDHELMIKELSLAGYPEAYVDITRDIYTSSTFQVKTANGLTRPIQREKGIIQGCPWSVVVF